MRASEKYFFSRTIFLVKLIYCGGKHGLPKSSADAVAPGRAVLEKEADMSE